MDLAPHVTNLSRALAAAGTAGGGEAEAFLERFAIPLESAIRLTLLEVVSEAAEEISASLSAGSVDVRLRGSNPDFTITTPSQSTGDSAREAVTDTDEASLAALAADEGPLPHHRPDAGATETARRRSRRPGGGVSERLARAGCRHSCADCSPHRAGQ